MKSKSFLGKLAYPKSLKLDRQNYEFLEIDESQFGEQVAVQQIEEQEDEEDKVKNGIYEIYLINDGEEEYQYNEFSIQVTVIGGTIREIQRVGHCHFGGYEGVDDYLKRFPAAYLEHEAELFLKTFITIPSEIQVKKPVTIPEPATPPEEKPIELINWNTEIPRTPIIQAIIEDLLTWQSKELISHVETAQREGVDETILVRALFMAFTQAIDMIGRGDYFITDFLHTTSATKRALEYIGGFSENQYPKVFDACIFGDIGEVGLEQIRLYFQLNHLAATEMLFGKSILGISSNYSKKIEVWAGFPEDYQDLGAFVKAKKFVDAIQAVIGNKVLIFIANSRYYSHQYSEDLAKIAEEIRAQIGDRNVVICSCGKNIDQMNVEKAAFDFVLREHKEMTRFFLSLLNEAKKNK